MANNTKANSSAENVASSIIFSIDKANPNINDLVRWLFNNLGIRLKINMLDLSTENCSGMEYYDPSIKSFRIYIDANESTARKRFTLCHEIAHIIKDGTSIYGLSKDGVGQGSSLERFCDRFSAAYLMPKELFSNIWKNIDDSDPVKIYRIARRFAVSKQAVYYRAKELSLI